MTTLTTLIFPSPTARLRMKLSLVIPLHIGTKTLRAIGGHVRAAPASA